jgi:putative peptidoglycan lipid II flippase
MAYSLGLLGFILVKVLAPAFYARKEMKTPVKIAVVALVSNIILNLILIGPLAHVGLALATSISAMLNAGLLYYFLLKQGVFSLQTPWRGFSLQVIFAVGVMALVLFFASPDSQAWLDFSAWQRVSWLLGLILVAMSAYVLTLLILGFKPRQFMGRRD